MANVVQRGEYNSSRWLGSLVRVLIIGLVLALGLRAMGIADSIVNLAFGLTLGAVAVAFALAFGLGGRQPAERLLSDLLDKAKKEASQPNPLYQPPTNNKTTGSSTTVSTPSTTTTAPSTTVSSDAKPADSAQVNPSQPPVNKPFGSTGENDEI